MIDHDLICGPTLLRLEPADVTGVCVFGCDAVICEVVAKTPHHDHPLDVIAICDPVGSISG